MLSILTIAFAVSQVCAQVTTSPEVNIITSDIADDIAEDCAWKKKGWGGGYGGGYTTIGNGNGGGVNGGGVNGGAGYSIIGGGANGGGAGVSITAAPAPVTTLVTIQTINTLMTTVVQGGVQGGAQGSVQGGAQGSAQGGAQGGNRGTAQGGNGLGTIATLAGIAGSLIPGIASLVPTITIAPRTTTTAVYDGGLGLGLTLH